MPKKSDFYGPKDTEDTAGFNTAADRWNAGEPVEDADEDGEEDAGNEEEG